MRSHNKKRELRLTAGALSLELEKLSFFFFGYSYFNRLRKTFQGSEGKREKGIFNNNAFFVPFIVTNRRKYA